MSQEKKQKVKADPAAEIAAKKLASQQQIAVIRQQFSQLKSVFDDVVAEFVCESGLLLPVTTEPPQTPPVRYTQNFVYWDDCFMPIVAYNAALIERSRQQFAKLGLVYPWDTQ